MAELHKIWPSDGVETLPPAFNAVVDEVLALKMKAEELGGFESLARIAKVEVDLAALDQDFRELAKKQLAIAKRLVSLEEQVGERAEVKLLHRLWRLALVWIGVQVLYSIARVLLAIKGAP